MLVAGNWKMNGLRADGLALARALVVRAAAGDNPECELAICPPATLLQAVGDTLRGSGIALGGQDCHADAKGAHTGDLSAPMLRDLGCAYVIVGHSERRRDHGESDRQVQAKAAAARAAELMPILCVGETLAEREAGQALAVIERQLYGSLPEKIEGSKLVIAYEPVWAIGTGRTPTEAEVAAVHAHIHRLLSQRVKGSEATRVLYGGSVKPDNARELLAIAAVNGALVGGASLVAGDFWAIAQACP